MIDLSAEEARVLGCLMEKAVTTPDNYPLSVNALINACNQSTNRDPIVNYDENAVERILESLREKGVSRRVRATGQRVVKHKHVLDEALGLSVPEFTVLGVLLLRGAQTPGELKQRTERWHAFRSLDDVEETLQRFAEKGYVRQLERRPGQKESRWITLVVPIDDSASSPMPAAPGATTARTPPHGDSRPGPAPEPAAEVASVAAPVVREEHSLEVHNPATGERIRSVAVTDAREIERKVERARRAQSAWAARSYDERAAVVRAFRDLLETEAEEIARVTTGEVGKPIVQSRNEVRGVLGRIEWNLARVGAVIAPRVVTDAGPGSVEERVTHDPVGLVAHVSAWNYPYFVGLNTIVPALLAGNAVLYKPSEHATLTGLRVVDMMHRSGVPVDVVQTIVGGGGVGAALVAADIDMVCFTGSYETGRRVARSVADRFVRLQLELGGKDGAYVCDDVDVETTAFAVAEGAFYNGGQSCSAIERVYVHDSVFDSFLDAFVDVVGAYRTGDPEDEHTDIGPLARTEQIDVLESQVADAVAKGARVVCGGSRIDGPGSWFEPTVLVDVDPTMSVMRDESFGPVIGLQRVRDDDDARACLDDTDFGLGAAVFSRDRSRAEQVLRGLEVGNAYWNRSDRSSVSLPWAGRRHSGMGVSMSESGVRAFVREKAWHLGP
jgi:acyl-CoA reductase-like NAD-dependent aldehyde dehydrogenase